MILSWAPSWAWKAINKSMANVIKPVQFVFRINVIRQIANPIVGDLAYWWIIHLVSEENECIKKQATDAVSHSIQPRKKELHQELCIY